MSTRRPSCVLMRFIKPCSRFRGMRFGCHVVCRFWPHIVSQANQAFRGSAEVASRLSRAPHDVGLYRYPLQPLPTRATQATLLSVVPRRCPVAQYEFKNVIKCTRFVGYRSTLFSNPPHTLNIKSPARSCVSLNNLFCTTVSTQKAWTEYSS